MLERTTNMADAASVGQTNVTTTPEVSGRDSDDESRTDERITPDLSTGKNAENPGESDASTAREPGAPMMQEPSFFVSSFRSSECASEDVPTFPVDALPPVPRRLVVEAAAAVSVPPELIAVPLLVGAGATIGKTRRLLVKDDWAEFPSLYAAIVAPSGSAKTPAAKHARRPLDVLQREAYALWEQLRRPDGGGPPLEHFFTTSATVEALAPMLQHSAGVLAHFDEFSGWVKSFNAYRAGKGTDRQVWVSLWSSETLKIDRRRAGPLLIPDPVVGVVGGIQPSVLPSLTEGGYREDGLLERILWSYPVVGVARWTTRTVSSEAQNELLATFRQLRAVGRPPEVRLSPGALDAFASWAKQNENLTSSVNGLVRGAYAKLPSQLARLVLILWCLEHPTDAAERPVSEDAMHAAIRVVEYFRQHAHRVFKTFRNADGSAVQTGSRHDQLLMRLRRIFEDAPARVWSLSDIHKALSNNFSGSDMRKALSVLADEGVIERAAPADGQRGRPAELWRLTIDERNEETKKVEGSAA